MALGDSARAQQIVAKARGWDPSKIQGSRGEPDIDISAFNNIPVPASMGDYVVGSIPGGPPDQVRGVADDHDTDIGEPRTTFNTPDTGRENASRRTTNANPTTGMPGA